MRIIVADHHIQTLQSLKTLLLENPEFRLVAEPSIRISLAGHGLDRSIQQEHNRGNQMIGQQELCEQPTVEELERRALTFEVTYQRQVERTALWALMITAAVTNSETILTNR